MSAMKKLMESLDRLAVEEDDVVETEISLTEDEDAVVELENIAEEMMLLCEQAMRIVRGLDRGQYGPIEDRARMYWYGHIMSAIGNNDFPSRSYSLMDTVREIAGEEEEEY